jgi:regulator of protease activity HflC (stomatin/prohibitin superfamily)
MGMNDPYDYENPFVELWRRHNRKVAVGALAFFGLLVLLGAFYTVDEGEKAIVTRFGAVVRVSDPGLRFKAPFIESVHTVSTRVQAMEWLRTKDGDSSMASYSKDQQLATIAVKVTWRVRPDEASLAQVYSKFKDVDGLAYNVIGPSANEIVKTVFGQYTAVRVVQERDGFNLAIEEKFRADMKATGQPVIVDTVQVQNIDFSQAYESAVDARMLAQVEVEKVTQNLEREKKTAEIAVVQAKGEADSNLAKAEAAAKATRLQGDAEAAAIRARSAALQSNPALVQLTLAEKWNGVLPTTMVPGSAVPFLSVR